MDNNYIKEVIEIEGLRILRKYPPDDILMNFSQTKLNRNIEAYNRENKLIWVIQEAPQGGKDQDKAYMNIWVKENRLIAGNFIGIDYLVNLTTGAVTPINKDTRPW